MDFIYGKVTEFFGWLSRGKKALEQKEATASESLSDQALRVNLHIWSTKTANQRKHRIDEILYSLPFFFGTHLEDKELHKRLLVEKGDCLLITEPRVADEKSTTHRKWILVYSSDDKGTLVNEKISYQSQKFVLVKDRAIGLQDFMQAQKLRPIERQYVFRPKQISARPETEESPKLNLSNVAPMLLIGQLNKSLLNFDSKRQLPVLTINVDQDGMTEEKINQIADEARKALTFGSRRIWRLWGFCRESPMKLTLVMENIRYGLLSSYVRRHRPTSQLYKFSVQMCEALRHLEKFDVVHGRLSLDCFLLTYNENVKLMMFGVCDWTLVPECDDHDEVDRCRWLAPECLPYQSEGMERVQYSLVSMVYTYGLVLWSLYHAAILPFEDEQAKRIQSAEFRVKNTPYCDEEMMSNDMVEVAKNCWTYPPDTRPRFKDLKMLLRQQNVQSKSYSDIL